SLALFFEQIREFSSTRLLTRFAREAFHPVAELAPFALAESLTNLAGRFGYRLRWMAVAGSLPEFVELFRDRFLGFSVEFGHLEFLQFFGSDFHIAFGE